MLLPGGGGGGACGAYRDTVAAAQEPDAISDSPGGPAAAPPPPTIPPATSPTTLSPIGGTPASTRATAADTAAVSTENSCIVPFPSPAHSREPSVSNVNTFTHPDNWPRGSSDAPGGEGSNGEAGKVVGARAVIGWPLYLCQTYRAPLAPAVARMGRVDCLGWKDAVYT